mmetsp:Transcript_49155/g.105292  ORF Transcript_49155/g.105292 Transcript_49155/m.105292 type:complete len:485 (+) Transcript_49155:62-1516(+)
MRLATLSLIPAAQGACGGLPGKLTCGACLDIVAGQPCDRYDTCECMSPEHLAKGCVAAGFCDPVQAGPAVSEGFGLRIAKAHGKRDYNYVRVSVVTQTPEVPEADFFDYSSQFKYRWTDNYLHTGLKEVTPGKVNTFTIGKQTVSVKIPEAGAGAAGVMIADPCFKSTTYSSPVGCSYGGKFQTDVRTPALLNAFVGSEDIDFWSILGDNFYDRTGAGSKEFFAKLSTEVKATPMVTVPGNHDYWVLGDPLVGTVADQCGNGHMQFYAQDAEASLLAQPGDSTPPFNFTVDPAGKGLLGCDKASPDNSRFYHQFGNIGLIAQSGAFGLEEYNGFMTESCKWLGTPGIEVGVIVGHWDKGGLGAGRDMDVPEFYDEMAKLPGCKEMAEAGNLKFFMGHTHCNVPHPHGHNDTGFMVAGQGMSGCSNYGIPVFDTTEDRNRVFYFDASTEDTFNNVTSCVGAKGWRNCLSLAEIWLDQPRTKSVVV